MSSMALSSRLPGNCWRTSSIEIPTPNSVLMTTEKTATYALSWRATTVSGSSRSDWIEAKPSSKVWVTTSDTGHATRKNR
jgi:hypothetical protein